MRRYYLLLICLSSLLLSADLNYTQAKKYLKEEKYADAVRIFAYVGANRRYLAPYCDYYQAVAAFRSGQYKQAAVLLERYIKKKNIPYYEEALQLLNDTYLNLGRGKEIHPLAAYRQVISLFGKSDYPAALRLLQQVSANADLAVLPEDAYYYLARAYMYCAEPGKAKAILESRTGAGAVYYLGVLAAHRKQHVLAETKYREVLRKYPDSEYAPQALYNLARSSTGITKQNYFREIYKHYPQSRYASGAAWAVGWEYYNKSQYKTALQIFMEGYDLNKSSEYADVLLYWAGKAYQKLGDEKEATRLFVIARQDYPARFYGWRAAQQLQSTPAFPTGKLRLKDIKPRTDKALREFLEIGEYEDAMAEAKLIANQEKKEQTLTVLQIYMAERAYQAGAYKEASLLAYSVLSKNPDYAAILPLLWQICYPRGYSKDVEFYAKKNNLDKNYVYALIREESLFDKRALSPADAYGLMQLIPPTATEIFKALKMDLKPEPELLYQPEINVMLGTYYLRKRLNHFEENKYLALAAYNAGPAAAERWLQQHPGGLKKFDIDTFVENITYAETRNYVKKAMRSYWIYSTIYAE